MIWKFQALTKSGLEIQETYEGRRRDVLDLILQKEYSLLFMYPDIKQWLEINMLMKKINLKDMSDLFEDWGHMLTSGMGLHESISSLSQTTCNQNIKHHLNDMHLKLMAGENLKKAIGEKFFPTIVSASLTCAEKAGRLSEIIILLAKSYKYQHKAKGRLLSACCYPFFMCCLLIGIMIFVSLKVIVQLRPMLPEQALNQPATKMVLMLTSFIQSYWIYVPVLLILSIVIFVFVIREKNCVFEDFLYKFPLFGQILKESNLSLCFTYLSILVQSGIPLTQAIDDVHEALSNTVTQRLMVCRSYMISGVNFSKALEKDSFFPTLIVVAVKKAEQTVRWEMYFKNIREYLDKRIETKIEMITNLIQPILLACVGIFLITIGLAFLVPVYGSLTKIAGGS